MSDTEIKGKRTEGWLLATPAQRTVKKSPFLRKLERAQQRATKPAARATVTPLQGRTRERT